MGCAEEPPRHFLDMDAYGPFRSRSSRTTTTRRLPGAARISSSRTASLPWRDAGDLRPPPRRFQAAPTARYARDDIKLFSAVVAHYIGDAFQPFHAAPNYDGQLTGQQGMHARFEAELFDRYQDKLHDRAARRSSTSPNVRDFMFASLTDSFRQVDAVLAADRDAAAGRTAYDDEYFAEFVEDVQPILEKPDWRRDHRRGVDDYQRMDRRGKARPAGLAAATSAEAHSTAPVNQVLPLAFGHLSSVICHPSSVLRPRVTVRPAACARPRVRSAAGSGAPPG